MKRAIIIGATSGIGQEVAKNLLREGWQIGIAGRRQPALEDFQRIAPEQIKIQSLDVTQADAAEKLNTLIRKLGGMDLFLLSSGIGFQNPELDIDIELNTARTNVEGFTRMVDTAFDYFKQHGGGHLAVISSIAGTKGLGIAPAYSATKRFQNAYIDALEQLSHLQKLNIRFTDIRPGFVATALLGDGKPDANESRQSGPSHYPRPEPQTPDGNHRRTLPRARFLLATDPPPVMETPARKKQKLKRAR